ncbi:MAG: BON domain-containing protein [Nitrospirota bacterium]|nr:BON domain-containing protein [Nitrospirota bacterium]
MKKANLLVRLCLCLALAVSMTACASTSQQESAGEYVDSTAITTKVKARIFEDQALKAFNISVETFKGVVQLSGFVDSKAAALKAEEVARSVAGVKSVKNNLIVK